MIELTQEQRQELSEPVPLAIDPSTRQTYVLLPAHRYERLKELLAEGTLYTTADLLDRTMAADDAGDPYLSELQRRYGTQQP